MLVFPVTLTADVLGVAPAGDETLGTNICTSSWQRASGDSRVEGGGGAQFNQHDVKIDDPGIIFGVTDDLGSIHELLMLYSPRCTWIWLDERIQVLLSFQLELSPLLVNPSHGHMHRPHSLQAFTHTGSCTLKVVPADTV